MQTRCANPATFRRICRACSALLACLMLATTVPAHGRQSQSASSPARDVPLFTFHSNFWVNLHQMLLDEALFRTHAAGRWATTPAALSAMHMPGQDVKKWHAAVDFYVSRFGHSDELFDPHLVQIENDLAGQPDSGLSLDPKGLPANLAGVLRAVAPIYRQYFWPSQNRSNRRWIAEQSARVRKLGPKLSAALTHDLQQPWPASPIREDVSFYVPDTGHAYTTLFPAHTTLSSSAASLQGLSGFDILFHEASHTFARTETGAIASECRIRHKDCGELWHALLFYTVGVELHRVLPPNEQAGFVPYAMHYGLYKGRWRAYLVALQTGWQPYLDGDTHFQTAIDRMVTALGH